MFDIKEEEEEEESEQDLQEEDSEVDEFGRRIKEEGKKKAQLKTYKFQVCDSLFNIGPITDFAVGESFDSSSVSIVVLSFVGILG